MVFEQLRSDSKSDSFSNKQNLHDEFQELPIQESDSHV
jgi:hypothetical protein